ncbi:MAG: glycosyltransferase family 2 protein [Candidatus Daviesbacteria bacterium]|nr:MAG: glycosyltransferase family 2 protein [Candidatus Daviesbacteria bacterium]
MKKAINLSVVVPVFNEEKRLPKNLEKIITYLKKGKASYEVILVDDGSTDKTWDVLNDFKNLYPSTVLKRHKENMGKGAAVKTGMLASNGKLVLMTDCDLSTPMEELKILLQYIKSHDIVIGSRRLKEKKLGRLPERYRTFLGDIYYELLRLILLPAVKDTNCGFKLFSKEVIKPVFNRQKINRWGYDAEVLFIADKLNFKIKEVPVKWTHYAGSKVKIFDAVTKTLGELLQIKINNLKGFYD